MRNLEFDNGPGFYTNDPAHFLQTGSYYHPGSYSPQPLPDIPQYHSNNVGPGYDAAENSFRKLQDASFRYEQSQLDEGFRYTSSGRTPDFACQLDSIRAAERAMPEIKPDFVLNLELEEAQRSAMLSSLRESTKQAMPEIKPDFVLNLELEEAQRSAMLSSLRESIGVELSPIRRTRTETIFQGAGHSHFSYVDTEEYSGFHVTTQIPGFGKKEGFSEFGLSVHDFVEEE